MDPSTLLSFSQQVELATTEVLAQQVNLFNAATRGGIVLRNGANSGDYTTYAKYGLLAGLVRRRNAYADGAVSPIEPARIAEGSVKVAGGTPPVKINPGLWDWIQRPQDIPGSDITGAEAAGTFIGQQLAIAALQDRLDVAISALVAAALNVGTTLYKDIGANPLTLNALAQGAALMGDRSNQIVCWVMHSASYFDLIDAALTNTAKLFEFGTVNIVSDGLGRPIIVTDSADLKNGSDYYALGLVAGGIVIEDNGAIKANVESTNGYENIRRTYQAEWDWNLALKGYAWDQSNGGPSPDDSALAVGTNWDQVATSVKDTAGVVVISET